MRNPAVKVAVATVFLCIAAGYFAPLLFPQRSGVSVNESSNVQVVSSVWSEELSVLGPEKTRQEFKRYYTAHPTNAHLAAHVFGDLLYDRDGMQALSYCDDSFGYGCYHEVMGRTVAEFGPSSFSDLAQYCDSLGDAQKGSCYHGLGHGVIAYYGYSDIPAALAACGTFRGQTYSCVNGAMMDYFAPLQPGEARAVTTRSMDPVHPYDVCATTAVAEQFKSACYSALASWWRTSADMATGQAIALCHRAGDYRDDCYAGVAVNLVGDDGYDQQRIIDDCKAIPDPSGVRSCLRNGAQVLASFKYENCEVKKAAGEGC